jgi:hypothetical protein
MTPPQKQVFIDAFYEDAGEDVTKHFPTTETLNRVFKQLHRLNPGGEITVPCPTVGRILSGAPKFKVVVGCYCGDCPYVGVYLMLYFSR